MPKNTTTGPNSVLDRIGPLLGIMALSGSIVLAGCADTKPKPPSGAGYYTGPVKRSEANKQKQGQRRAAPKSGGPGSDL